MASDLEASLIDGGIPATAAKVIANAIDNVATGKTYIGRQTEDATPSKRLRLVDADTRRYVLTNLDHPSEENLRDRLQHNPSQFDPRVNPHPYQDSQPSTANPTLSVPSVKPGDFVRSDRKTEGEVAQSEVALDRKEEQGSHARLNKATGRVESVPIIVECTPNRLIEAEVVEEEGRTVIRIRLKGPLERLTGFSTASHTSWRSGTTSWVIPTIQ